MDRHNYSFGGEIPHRLGKELFSNENSLNEFIGYSSGEKNTFIRNSRAITNSKEMKNYVDTMGESHRTNYDFDHNFYK
ncbi:MAG: hypothetical protein IJX42_07925 [Oscillospiraceae bacterium]|nr:hypothetical protein [Oscillospiraceae bacterium]MBQ8379043.1 hypothetical protein [Oscillospiraceae bacterium]